MPSLLHHSPHAYQPGDVIFRIGRRNRILKLDEDDLLRIREERFEEIRSREFPDAVSRLDCNWVYEDVAPALRGMKDGNSDPRPNLYAVELIDDHSRFHRGALDIINRDWALAFTGGEQARDELVREYWRGQGAGPGGTELLVDGDLRVVAVLITSRSLPEVDVEQIFSIETDED